MRNANQLIEVIRHSDSSAAIGRACAELAEMPRFVVSIDGGKIRHRMQSESAARIAVDVARRLGRAARIVGQPY